MAVDHASLTDSAYSVFGIHDIALGWLPSFVTDCIPQIAVRSEKSAVFQHTSDVPQGLGLGPVLMYMLPAGDVISRHDVQHHHQYVDDDIQLYDSLNPADLSDLSVIESRVIMVYRECVSCEPD